MERYLPGDCRKLRKFWSDVLRLQPTRCIFLSLFIPVSSKLHILRQVFVIPILLHAASLARLPAGSSNGLTNAWRCMCSFELLMMDGSLTEINKLWNVASCWLYSANILAMHGHMNVKVWSELCENLARSETGPLWRRTIALTLHHAAMLYCWG